MAAAWASRSTASSSSAGATAVTRRRSSARRRAVVEAVAGQDLEPAVVLVAPEHGGGGREGVEDEVQVLAGQLGNGVGHGHTLLSGRSMHRRIRGVHARLSNLSGSVPIVTAVLDNQAIFR